MVISIFFSSHKVTKMASNEKGGSPSDGPSGGTTTPGVFVEHRSNTSLPRGANDATAANIPTATLGNEDIKRMEANAKLNNPLSGMGREKLMAMGEEFALKHCLNTDEDVRAFRLGAVIAGDDVEGRVDGGLSELTDRERDVLQKEVTHKWANPGMLYWVVASEFINMMALTWAVKDVADENGLAD